MKIGNDDVKKVYIGGSVVSKVYSSYYDEDVRSTILKSMVCWYDPHRQGCTNVNMAANPVLIDFSGNKRNMTCHNFDWNTECGIAGDRSLRFKRGAYGYVKKPVLTDFTIICQRKYVDTYENQILASTKNEVPLEDDSANSGAFQMENDQYINCFGSSTFRGTSYFWDSDYRTVYMTKTNYNGEINIIPGSKPDTNDLYLGSDNPELHPSKGFNGNISCFMLFNRTLTDEEITWVKANLIENRYRYLVCPIVGVADPNVDLDGIRDENGFLWIEAD